MRGAIAFFPWVRVSEPVTVGPVRLIPYIRGRLPGDSINVSQTDLDYILEAYASRKDQPVLGATLLEIGRWRLGDDLTGKEQRIFEVRELVAFSALAARRLFGGLYCNFDTYALTIQRYQSESAGAFSFTTRRRDGGTSQLWDAEAFTFLKPLHVDFDAGLQIDEALLRGLLKAVRRDGRFLDAIMEFNRANTDSADVPTHTEVVMTKSAFEFLLGINEKNDEFVRAIKEVAPWSRAPDWPQGPLAERWRTKFPKATRPLEAWAREFCDWRGSAAHGKRRGGRRFIWSEASHLAFSAILFPLVIKRKLVSGGFMPADERDEIHLDCVDSYIVHDPFVRKRGRRLVYEHPWSRVYGEEVLGEMMARGLRKRAQALTARERSARGGRP